MIDLLRRYPLPVIVLAQLFGTSLWFSINGVWLSLAGELGLTESDLGRLTLAVQAGFIAGTLTIAVTGLADRFGASRIFALSSLLGALVNGGFIFAAGAPPLPMQPPPISTSPSPPSRRFRAAAFEAAATAGACAAGAPQARFGRRHR